MNGVISLSFSLVVAFMSHVACRNVQMKFFLGKFISICYDKKIFLWCESKRVSELIERIRSRLTQTFIWQHCRDFKTHYKTKSRLSHTIPFSSSVLKMKKFTRRLETGDWDGNLVSFSSQINFMCILILSSWGNTRSCVRHWILRHIQILIVCPCVEWAKNV